MNPKGIPVISTLIVMAAVAVMIGLGIWQLGRAEQKSDIISRYEQVLTNRKTTDWPQNPSQIRNSLYHLTTLECLRVVARRSTAGRSVTGTPGYIQVATCQLADGDLADISLGFMRVPNDGQWLGGIVSGIIAPGPRLVATPPIEGLMPQAAPDPRSLPNNHLAYAGQWFLFAISALVIFIIAARKKFINVRKDID